MAQGDIQGTITDGSGNPVSGVTVFLINQDNPNNVVRTTTDSGGNYIFNVHPDGDGSTQNYYVTAYYDNGSNLFNTLSKPNVTANLDAIPTSVVARYQFEDDSDTSTAIDSKGSNDATISGATYDTASAEGALALSFDGTDDLVNAPYNLDQSQSFSFITWVKRSSDGILLDGRNSSFGGGVLEDSVDTSDQYLFSVRTDGGFRGVQERVFAPSGSGVYEHVVGVCDISNSELRIYVDGSRKNTSTLSITPSSGDDLVIIGAQSGGSDGVANKNHLDGLLDDAMIADDALTDQQVSSLYNTY